MQACRSVSSKDDPLGAPVVDHNYLADPLDEIVLAEGCKLANEILMEGKATKEVVKGSWPEKLTHDKNKSREDWIPHVKQTASTCYHPSGTCKMGMHPQMIVWQSSMSGCVSKELADCVWWMSVSCKLSRNQRIVPGPSSNAEIGQSLTMGILKCQRTQSARRRPI